MKLEYGKPLSNFAFPFNLRRYILAFIKSHLTHKTLVFLSSCKQAGSQAFQLNLSHFVPDLRYIGGPRVVRTPEPRYEVETMSKQSGQAENVTSGHSVPVLTTSSTLCDE